MNILVVFTYGYSLKTWVESGTLERELSIYRELQNKFDHKFTFLTYGDISDNEINIMNLDVDIIPIYKFQKKSKFKLIDILNNLSEATLYSLLGKDFLKVIQYRDDKTLLTKNSLIENLKTFKSDYEWLKDNKTRKTILEGMNNDQIEQYSIYTGIKKDNILNNMKINSKTLSLILNLMFCLIIFVI